MRLALAAICLPVSVALAVEIPVSATYGTSNAVCAAYKAVGAVGQLHDDSAFIVSPGETVYMEGGCAPEAVSGSDITLTCSGEGDEWTSRASIAFDAAGDTLFFTDENGTIELHRCP